MSNSARKQGLVTHCKKDDPRAVKLAEHFKKRDISTKCVAISQDGAQDKPTLVNFVFWLPIISRNTFQSGANVAAVHRLLETLNLSEKRVFPLVLGGDDELRNLRTHLPSLAAKMPLVINIDAVEKELPMIPELLDKRLKRPLSYTQSILSFDALGDEAQSLWFDSLWETKISTKVLPVRDKKLGIDIKYVEDSFGKYVVYVKGGIQSDFKPGDRLVEVEGFPVNASSSIKRIKMLAEKKSSLLFKVRQCNGTENEFANNLEAFRFRKTEWSNSKRPSSEKPTVYSIYFAEDSDQNQLIEKMLPSDLKCQRVELSREKNPTLFTISFNYILLLITPALLDSPKPKKSLFRLFHKVKPWKERVVPVFLDVPHPSRELEFENSLHLACDEDFSELYNRFTSTDQSLERNPRSKSIVLDILKSDLENDSEEATNSPIPLKKERKYESDRGLAFIEAATFENSEIVNEKFKVLEKDPHNVDTQDLLDFASSCGIDYSNYKSLHNFSLAYPDQFWGPLAKEFDFRFEDDTDIEADFRKNVISKEFFEGRDDDCAHSAVQFMPRRKTNLCVNMLDRHIGSLILPVKRAKYDRSDQTAIIFVSSSHENVKKFTYKELFHATCKYAQHLESTVKLTKDNRVLIYMDESPARIVAILACLRIGATVGVEDRQYEKDSQRTYDLSKSDFVITRTKDERSLTVSEGWKKEQEDEENDFSFAIQDFWDSSQTVEHKPTWVDSCHPAFFAKTTGTTKPAKVVQQPTGGFMVNAAVTVKYILDYNLESIAAGPQPDVCLATSDLCWVYGWTVGFCAPLLIGGTTVRVAGISEALKRKTIWDKIAEFKVTHLCSIPRAVKLIIDLDDENLAKLSSLKVVASAGDRLYDKTAKALSKKLKDREIKVFDVYGQTETGGCFMLASCCSIHGVNTHPKQLLPFYGVDPTIKTMKNKNGVPHRVLAIKKPWPSCFLNYHDSEYYKTAFSDRVYVTGDNVEGHVDRGASHPKPPALYVLVGRTETVFNFMIESKCYSVAAEDIEELCSSRDFRTLAEETEDGKLQITVDLKNQSLDKKNVEEWIESQIDELRNYAFDYRRLKIIFEWDKIKSIRGKFLRRRESEDSYQRATGSAKA